MKSQVGLGFGGLELLVAWRREGSILGDEGSWVGKVWRRQGKRQAARVRGQACWLLQMFPPL